MSQSTTWRSYGVAHTESGDRFISWRRDTPLGDGCWGIEFLLTSPTRRPARHECGVASLEAALRKSGCVVHRV